MSADLKRCQALAEPLGMKVEWDTGNWYGLHQGTVRLLWVNSLAPIRERLAKEYRESARREKGLWDIYRQATGRELWDENTDMGTDFTRLADELSAPEEPTMVEKLRGYRYLNEAAQNELVFKALIDLYERKG